MHVEAPAAAAGEACNKHIVLVHGACAGGWYWFKVATRLRSAGYRVSTPDLAASGVDPRPLREVPTFRDYTQPLLDLLGSLPPGDKVVLVGHSLGGVNVALAAELFPEKVAAAVFLSAFMPDHASPPSHVLEKFVEGKWLDWMDTEMKPQDPEGKLPISMLFGPQVTRAKLYQMCSPEDLTLGRSLMRVGSMFVDDLKLQPPYSEGRYGSVRKVFIICKDDHAIAEGFQRWLIENNPVEEVMEIGGADHMPMLSTPDELMQCLAHIAEKYVMYFASSIIAYLFVTKIEGQHNCASSSMRVSSMASQAWVADRLMTILRNKPTMGAKDLQEKLQNDYNVTIGYDTVWKGKNKAMDVLYGTWGRTFKFLFNFKAEIEKRSPRSIVQVDVVEVKR